MKWPWEGRYRVKGGKGRKQRFGASSRDEARRTAKILKKEGFVTELFFGKRKKR